MTQRARHDSDTAQIAASVAELGGLDAAAAFARLGSSAAGLSSGEAAARLAADGPNQIAEPERDTPWHRLGRALLNPVVLLLAVLAGVSLATGDARAAAFIGVMIVIGVSLRFVQETRADRAAAALKAMIRVTVAVIRDGAPGEIPLHDVVRGDVVTLSAGDMIPADVRLVWTRDLFVNQASLTGESLPVEKSAAAVAGAPPASPADATNLCFLGTSVASGTATGVVGATGGATCFGRLARALAEPEEPTAFDRGVSAFTWLMIRFIAVMVPLVFFINGLTGHGWREAFVFALAVAVGLTPEMLPMIVSVSLSRGAVAMARHQVIVKRLAAIQNFGAMDVLCTDKTGTLTMDHVILQHHRDLDGDESPRVLFDALLVSRFQTGLRNLLDRAVVRYAEEHGTAIPDGYVPVDELPFDFERKIMSVVVATPEGGRRLVAKGAHDELLERCTACELRGAVTPLSPEVVAEVRAAYAQLSGEGFRVLAIAARDLPVRDDYTLADERDLVLVGYVAFLDPPKDSAGPAIAALRRDGVAVKVLTGDNELVSACVCRQVGLPAGPALLGPAMDAMTDDELGAALDGTGICAHLSPGHKQRIIQVLRRRGHVVGFLGDGINDAPALHAADVGISVDAAVDVAKESADIILLEKSLLVLDAGVREGRKVFANILKYVRMGASSNFGNMLSVVGASAVLPFLPMAPVQVLANNLLYDISQVPIPGDNVDADQVVAPHPWSVRRIRRFILLVGPVSSLFDYTTFAALWFGFGARDVAHQALFQTGWFVESLFTQTLIIHVIRTARVPFLQSRSSWQLAGTTALVMAIGAWLPSSPFAASLGLTALPGAYWAFLAATVAAYVVTVQIVKRLVLHAAEF
ncbi:MAG: magnesium-translocating P-type ATPase [Gemmatimonadota bacterium]|nr:magnesium-translocating P-type ATPase [Gemmatimonadota bacterium]MDE3215384.1 magnesium-translocating P-type ATPase [Gemmatimonadota bacterium]